MAMNWLSPEAERLLRAFALSGTAFSAHPLDEQRWFAFLIQAHLDGLDPDSGNIRRWLIDEAKFPDVEAANFASRYASERELLTAYDARRP